MIDEAPTPDLAAGVDARPELHVAIQAGIFPMVKVAKENP
jgi:hypothetical protein